MKNWPTWNGMSYSKWPNYGKSGKEFLCFASSCIAVQYPLIIQFNFRNGKKYIPYDPIPTQHELLLFSPCPRAVGILASYPRSGNSLMRTLYEHTTLRVTGSDMQGGLAKHGELGATHQLAIFHVPTIKSLENSLSITTLFL